MLNSNRKNEWFIAIFTSLFLINQSWKMRAIHSSPSTLSRSLFVFGLGVKKKNEAKLSLLSVSKCRQLNLLPWLSLLCLDVKNEMTQSLFSFRLQDKKWGRLVYGSLDTFPWLFGHLAKFLTPAKKLDICQLHVLFQNFIQLGPN